jgi:hypothetical protein
MNLRSSDRAQRKAGMDQAYSAVNTAYLNDGNLPTLDPVMQAATGMSPVELATKRKILIADDKLSAKDADLRILHDSEAQWNTANPSWVNEQINYVAQRGILASVYEASGAEASAAWADSVMRPLTPSGIESRMDEGIKNIRSTPAEFIKNVRGAMYSLTGDRMWLDEKK